MVVLGRLLGAMLVLVLAFSSCGGVRAAAGDTAPAPPACTTVGTAALVAGAAGPGMIAGLTAAKAHAGSGPCLLSSGW